MEDIKEGNLIDVYVPGGIESIIIDPVHVDELNSLDESIHIGDYLKEYISDDNTKKYHFYEFDTFVGERTGRSFIWSKVVKSQYVAKRNLNEGVVRKTYNKGDLAEGILAAAAFAKFLEVGRSNRLESTLLGANGEVSPNVPDITVNHIKSILGDPGLRNNQEMKSGVFEVNNIKFHLRLIITLSNNNFNAIVNPEVWNNDNDIKDLLSSAVRYVNSQKVEANILDFYLNNSPDTNSKNAKISSEGTLDQKSKKADVVIRVWKNNTRSASIMLNASIKTTSQNISQQGVSYKSIYNLFHNIFGVKGIDRFRDEFTRMKNENWRFDEEKALYERVFVHAMNFFEYTAFKNNHAVAVDKLSDALFRLSANNDESVRVIQFKGGSYSRQNPSLIKKGLLNLQTEDKRKRFHASLTKRAQPSFMIYWPLIGQSPSKPSHTGKIVEFVLEVRTVNKKPKVNKIHVYKGKSYDKIVNEA